VTLSGQGNGTVIADAVRIVPNTPASVQGNSYNIYTDHLERVARRLTCFAENTRTSAFSR
jgi:muramidase (phage lysozyme)